MSSIYKTNSSPNLRDSTPQRLKLRQLPDIKSNKIMPNYQHSRYASTPIGEPRKNPITCQVDVHDHDDDDDDDDNDGEQPFVVGDRVIVDGLRRGSVAYFGKLDFAPGDWVGVVLDDALGQHDGKVHGREYFHCARHHGTFVRPNRLQRLAPLPGARDSAIGSSISSSHQSSPTNYSRTSNHESRYSPVASGRSTSESLYYYDHDYRSLPRPSADSLRRKLQNINQSPASQQLDQGKRQQRGILKTRNGQDNKYLDNQQISSPRYTSSSSSSNPPSRAASCSGIDNTNRSPSSPLEPTFNFRPRRIPLQQSTSSNLNKLNSQSTGRLDSLETTNYPRQLDQVYEPRVCGHFRLGDRVIAHSDRGDLVGTLKFMGETNFATGEWAGIELDRPEGRNDGSVLGYKYFNCEPNYGLMVPLSRISRLSPSSQTKHNNLGRILKSTIKSPPPLRQESQSTRTTRFPVSSYQSNYDSYTSSPASRSSSAISSSWSESPASPVSSNRIDFYDRHAYQRTKSATPEATKIAPSRHEQPNERVINDNHFRSSPTFTRNNINDSRKTIESNSSPDELDDYVVQYLKNRRSTSGTTSQQMQKSPMAKSVKYTFKSSKYDGNPIVLKTVDYEDN